MVIHSIELTYYVHGKSGHTTEEFVHPSWGVVERELRTMDRYEKPILWILRQEGSPECDCLALCGGNDIYHIQVCENSDWKQAINPVGGDEEVDVWISDQGFNTQKKYTWDTESTLEIVSWYCEHGKAHPKYEWK